MRTRYVDVADVRRRLGMLCEGWRNKAEDFYSDYFGEFISIYFRTQSNYNYDYAFADFYLEPPNWDWEGKEPPFSPIRIEMNRAYKATLIFKPSPCVRERYIKIGRKYRFSRKDLPFLLACMVFYHKQFASIIDEAWRKFMRPSIDIRKGKDSVVLSLYLYEMGKDDCYDCVLICDVEFLRNEPTIKTHIHLMKVSKLMELSESAKEISALKDVLKHLVSAIQLQSI